MKYNEPYIPSHPQRTRNYFFNAVATVLLLFIGMLAGSIFTAYICYHLWH